MWHTAVMNWYSCLLYVWSIGLTQRYFYYLSKFRNVPKTVCTLQVNMKRACKKTLRSKLGNLDNFLLKCLISGNISTWNVFEMSLKCQLGKEKISFSRVKPWFTRALKWEVCTLWFLLRKGEIIIPWVHIKYNLKYKSKYLHKHFLWLLHFH